MVRRMFLLVMLGTFLAIGGFWALRAQDPRHNKLQPQPRRNSRQPSIRRLSSIFQEPTPGRLLIAKVRVQRRHHADDHWKSIYDFRWEERADHSLENERIYRCGPANVGSEFAR